MGFVSAVTPPDASQWSKSDSTKAPATSRATVRAVAARASHSDPAALCPARPEASSLAVNVGYLQVRDLGDAQARAVGDAEAAPSGSPSARFEVKCKSRPGS
jgi:hypothetical protein